MARAPSRQVSPSFSTPVDGGRPGATAAGSAEARAPAGIRAAPRRHGCQLRPAISAITVGVLAAVLTARPYSRGHEAPRPRRYRARRCAGRYLPSGWVLKARPSPVSGSVLNTSSGEAPIRYASAPTRAHPRGRRTAKDERGTAAGRAGCCTAPRQGRGRPARSRAAQQTGKHDLIQLTRLHTLHGGRHRRHGYPVVLAGRSTCVPARRAPRSCSGTGTSSLLQAFGHEKVARSISGSKGIRPTTALPARFASSRALSKVTGVIAPDARRTRVPVAKIKSGRFVIVLLSVVCGFAPGI